MWSLISQSSLVLVYKAISGPSLTLGIATLQNPQADNNCEGVNAANACVNDVEHYDITMSPGRKINEENASGVLGL